MFFLSGVESSFRSKNVQLLFPFLKLRRLEDIPSAPHFGEEGVFWKAYPLNVALLNFFGRLTSGRLDILGS